MDTDNLTPMAYETLSLAYKAFGPMRSEIGASAMHYEDEDAFLHGVAAFMQGIIDDPGGYLALWSPFEEVDLITFLPGVLNVKKHVERTLNTPRIERGDPPF